MDKTTEYRQFMNLTGFCAVQPLNQKRPCEQTFKNKDILIDSPSLEFP